MAQEASGGEPTAYVLYLNGLVKETARTLSRVQMPNRNGFVVDPRPDVGKSRSESAAIAAEARQQRGPPEPDDGAELGGSLGARPAAMLHRDTRAVADGFEANFDLGGFAGPEWVARPFKEQPHSGL